MNRFTRAVAPVAVAVSLGSVVAGASASSAFADGKSTLRCSQPYTWAPIGTQYGPPNSIDYLSQSLVGEGFFTQDSMLSLLNSLDHNGNHYLCYKTPQGWTGPPSTNAAQRLGFFNLVDDKVISG